MHPATGTGSTALDISRQMNNGPDDEASFFAPHVITLSSGAWQARLIDASCIAVTVALLSLVAAGWVGLARVLLTLAFAVYVPGWAVVGYCMPDKRGSQAALPVLVSVTLLTASGTFTLWLHVWNPMLMFDILAGASILLISATAIRRERTTRAEPKLADATPEDNR